MDGEAYSFAIDTATGQVSWGESASSTVTMTAVNEFGVGFEARLFGIPSAGQRTI